MANVINDVIKYGRCREKERERERETKEKQKPKREAVQHYRQGRRAGEGKTGAEMTNEGAEGASHL